MKVYFSVVRSGCFFDFSAIGTQGELIDEALFSDAISSDINDVDGAVYISKANLPIDEQILEAQNNGAVAVIYASPTYCKYQTTT